MTSISSILPQAGVGIPGDGVRSGDDPTRMEFWARPGAGYRLLAAVAAAHAGAGLLGAAAGVLVWYFSTPMVVLPALAAVLGAIAALAGAIAFELARSWGPRAALIARVLLPATDLVTAALLLWLLGDSALILLLFVLPALVATLLLSWRSGAVFAAVSVACFAVVNVPRPGVSLSQWGAETLALAGMATVVVLSLGVYAEIVSSIRTALRGEIARLAEQRVVQATEQQRLLETLNLLEDAQARLENERVLVNQQIAEVASTAHRLADGDPGAVRALQPGMFGPLDAVRAALGRLSLRLVMGAGLAASTRERQQALDAALAASREQAHLLAATDTALHALGVSANELVAEVQVVERGSGELPGIDRRRLFQVMRAMEQRALAQASNTAMLGARLGQLRSRQGEMEAELRRLNALSQQPGARPEWERSGLYGQPAQTQTQPGMGESHVAGDGENRGSWR